MKAPHGKVAAQIRGEEADCMFWQSSLNSYVDRNVCAWFDFEGDASGEIGEEDGEFGPFEVPAVFDGEEGVAARKDG